MVELFCEKTICWYIVQRISQLGIKKFRSRRVPIAVCRFRDEKSKMVACMEESRMILVELESWSPGSPLSSDVRVCVRWWKTLRWEAEEFLEGSRSWSPTSKGNAKIKDPPKTKDVSFFLCVLFKLIDHILLGFPLSLRVHTSKMHRHSQSLLIFLWFLLKLISEIKITHTHSLIWQKLMTYEKRSIIVPGEDQHLEWRPKSEKFSGLILSPSCPDSSSWGFFWALSLAFCNVLYQIITLWLYFCSGNIKKKCKGYLPD